MNDKYGSINGIYFACLLSLNMLYYTLKEQGENILGHTGYVEREMCHILETPQDGTVKQNH